MAEDEPAGERDAGVLDRPHRRYRRRQIAFGIARTPPVDMSFDPLGPERRVAPVLRRPLGHHVGVRLEEQGLARMVAFPSRPDVRTPRCYLLRTNLETLALEVVRDKAGYPLLVPPGLLGTVDARDTDAFLRKARHLLAVHPAPPCF